MTSHSSQSKPTLPRAQALAEENRANSIRPKVDKRRRRNKPKVRKIEDILKDLDSSFIDIKSRLERSEDITNEMEGKEDPIPLPLANPSTTRMYVGDKHYYSVVDEEWVRLYL